MQLKSGARLKSSVCETQVMVIATPADAVELKCGGAPMVDITVDAPASAAAADLQSGTQIGKRYVNEDGSLEVLCTKPGAGTLCLGDTPLALKEARALPSSD